ncbi:hypothetical protein U1Q18_007813 [Sarracenia purpurea var. burkii]
MGIAADAYLEVLVWLADSPSVRALLSKPIGYHICCQHVVAECYQYAAIVLLGSSCYKKFTLLVASLVCCCRLGFGSSCFGCWVGRWLLRLGWFGFLGWGGLPSTMNATITDYQVPDGTHGLYDVYLFNDRIQTLVTHTPALVESWISDIESFHSRRLHRLIVGLDVEWRPNYSRYRYNPVATLQLCVGRRCLIFQLIHAPFIPSSLVEFLDNPMYTFVGVGVDNDADKLAQDYDLSVATTVELGPLAAQEYGVRALRYAGLKKLAGQVLGKEIEKPRNITMSRWDNEWLSPAQVQYACIDAFLSFEIGRCLHAAGN